MVVPYPEFVELCAQSQPLLRRHAAALLEVNLLCFLVTGEHSNFAAHPFILPEGARKAALRRTPDRWVDGSPRPWGWTSGLRPEAAATKDPAPSQAVRVPSPRGQH